jgi:circadian clock protein KaiC
METPVDLSYLSDSIIMLRYFEAQGRVRRAISVLKKRSGKHEDAIREFQLTSEGLKVGPPLTQFSGILTGTPTFVGNQKPLMPE